MKQIKPSEKFKKQYKRQYGLDIKNIKLSDKEDWELYKNFIKHETRNKKDK